MELQRSMVLVAKGLLVLATLALCQAVSRAGCDGCCSTGLSLGFHHCGGASCHYKPGCVPTLCSPGTFGYFPTVWSVWPGPLDPNTSYPGVPVKPAVVSPAEKPADKPK